MSDETTIDDVVEPVEAAEVVETPVTSEDKVNAFMKGVDEATEKPVEAVKEPEPKVDEPKPDDQKAVQKAADDKELKDLGVKNERAKEQYRKLSADSRELTELKKTVPQLQEMAERQSQMQWVIDDCKATPDQIGNAFRYMKAMNSGDPKQMAEYADKMYAELVRVNQELGREIPGTNILEGHPDLKDKVEAGHLTREDALELTKLRGHSKMVDSVSQQRTQQQQQAEDFKQAGEKALGEINQLEAQWRKTDPNFKEKLPSIAATIEAIRDNMHPSKWPGAIKAAYAKIPEPRPIVAAASPVRPNQGGQAGAKHLPKDPMQRFMAGVQSVTGGGGDGL